MENLFLVINSKSFFGERFFWHTFLDIEKTLAKKKFQIQDSFRTVGTSRSLEANEKLNTIWEQFV